MPTTSLNVGFPSAFSSAYARFGSPKMFAPEQSLMALNNTEGQDFQALWHQQKMRDANHMAGAKVRATHSAQAKSFSSPHGYFEHPRPVLGQRKFANASMGSLYTHTTREDQASTHAPWVEVDNRSNPYETHLRSGGSICGNHLVGGVLRTSAGQRHGKATLDARVAQLNAIQEAKQNFLSQGISAQLNANAFAGAAPSEDALLSASPLVELANLLQTIKDSLIKGDPDMPSRDTFSDFSRAFPLIVRMATNNPPADIANVLQFVEGTTSGDGIKQLLEDKLQTYLEDGYDAEQDMNADAFVSRLQAQLEWWGRIERYLKEMLKISEEPARTRQNASNALIKSVGFAKLQRDINTTYKTGIVPENTFIDTTGHINNPQNAQRALDAPARAGRSGAFINPAFVFTPSSRRREDTQHGFIGTGGAEFDTSTQNAYAYGSGEYQDNTGGRPRAWAGTEVLAEYGQAPEEEATIGLNEQEETENQQLYRTVVPKEVRDAIDKLADDWDNASEEDRPAIEEERERRILMAKDIIDAHVRQKGRQGMARLTSHYDPKTEGFNIRGEESESDEEEEKELAPAPKKAPQSKSKKPYTSADVPRDMPGLIEFIKSVKERFPSYSQRIYQGSKPRSVRINTISLLEKAGLL